MHPELTAALARTFPGFEATAGQLGLAELERLFGEGTGPYDLDEWVRRRNHLLHPAWGLNEQSVERRLQGPTRYGVEAASITTVQGRDGLWYMCTGFSVPGSGSFSPMGGSPFESEREAVEAGVAKIMRRATGILGSSHATATDLKWARKIEAWAQEQLTPQGVLEL